MHIASSYDLLSYLARFTGPKSTRDKPMRSALLLCLWALSLTTTAAYADTLQNFDYEGTFKSTGGPFPGQIIGVGGTLTIDTTTGVLTGASPFTFTYPNDSTAIKPITDPPRVSSNAQSLYISLDSVLGTQPPNDEGYATLILAVPGTTLVGYNGSYLCSASMPCPDGNISEVLPTREEADDLLTGSVTPVAATPEPTSLMLLGTGLVSLGTMRKRLSGS